MNLFRAQVLVRLEQRSIISTNIQSEKPYRLNPRHRVKALRQKQDVSAHADQTGLLDWFAAVAPSKPRLIITHGENRARKTLAGLIRAKHGVKPEIPNLGDVIKN